MYKRLYPAVLMLTALLTPYTAWGDTTAQDTLALPAENWEISLLTCGPGPEIYELEGHSALRMKQGDIDEVANWGLFDFYSPGFVYRFVKGETDYMVGTCPYTHFIRPYEAQGRSVTEQVLNLTPEEASLVVAFVAENMQPGNRVYRYNYIKDNCATRPLAIIEKAIGDTIKLSEPRAEIIENATFRNNMRYYHRNYPWYQFGIDLALGSDLDAPISRRETAFAPVALEEMVSLAAKSNGEPLVKETRIRAEERAGGASEGPTPWYLGPVMWCWIIFAAAAGLSWFDIYRHRISKVFDAIMYTSYGLAGCVITYLTFISVHEPANPNWLLLWLNPLCLLVPLLIWTKGTNKLLVWYQIANFAALIAMATVWIAGTQEPNPAFIPLLGADALRSATYLIISRCNPYYKKRSRYRVNYYAR